MVLWLHKTSYVFAGIPFRLHVSSIAPAYGIPAVSYILMSYPVSFETAIAIS